MRLVGQGSPQQSSQTARSEKVCGLGNAVILGKAFYRYSLWAGETEPDSGLPLDGGSLKRREKILLPAARQRQNRY